MVDCSPTTRSNEVVLWNLMVSRTTYFRIRIAWFMIYSAKWMVWAIFWDLSWNCLTRCTSNTLPSPKWVHDINQPKQGTIRRAVHVWRHWNSLYGFDAQDSVISLVRYLRWFKIAVLSIGSLVSPPGQYIQGLHKTAAMTNDSFDDGTNPHLAGCSKMSKQTSTRKFIVVYMIDISCHICPAISC